MLITPLDPDPSEPDVAGVHRVLAAATAVDRPADPLPLLEEVGARLRNRRPDWRRSRWVARDATGTIVAQAELRMPQLDNLHLGLVGVTVHPGHRRQGIGTALLRTVVAAADAEGRGTLFGEADEDTAGADFVRALDVPLVATDRMSLLRLTDVEWADVDALAATKHPGHRLEAWADRCPDELVESYARAKTAMNDAPIDDIDFTDFVYTVETVRADEASARSRGAARGAVAVHEETGEVVAFTELLLLHRSPRAYQNDTAVVPAHRGSGLGLWVKADLLVRLRAEQPEVTEILTGNAASNAHMLRINDRLGFREWNRIGGHQIGTTTLAARLGPEPFEGARLDPADVAALHRVALGSGRTDRPEDPVPSAAEFADRLTVRRGGRRTFRWLVRSGGTPVGHLVMDLSDVDNTHLGLFDLSVHPDHRRHGVGSALVRAAARLAAAEGRRSLLVEAYEGSGGAEFCRTLGLAALQNERISLLRLADPDRADVAALAAAAHPGYRLDGWVGRCPADLLDRFGRAKAAMNDSPRGEMDLGPLSYSTDQLRAEEDRFRALGREFRVVVAVHEATGEIAALTELAVARDPYRSDQEDTAVVAGHRGTGLGLWVKAAMLVRLLAERPDVAELTTGNADDNAHMLRINDRIGFRPYATIQEWQADVPALVSRLG